MPRSCDTWADMLAQAGQLPDDELRRHAYVSISNNHQCVECFTCACAEHMRAKARIFPRYKTEMEG